MTDREFRESLKVGDSVILYEGNEVKLKQVVRLTATRVFIDDGEGYRKDNGERWGHGSTSRWRSAPQILPPTDDRIRMYYQKDVAKKTAIKLAEEVIAIARGRDGIASHEWLDSAVSQMRGIKKP
ncbi:MAG: hypothetical protein CMF22_12080 [Idiomarinaceae bacterium]|nr:hypothetical protein [Idiomarinaceae bacterium]|tara:strand:+ start:4960 stop:5334 length:375 start_codon:yes stop_codon:yes gene_type:complete